MSKKLRSYKGVSYLDGLWVRRDTGYRNESIYGALYVLIANATEEDRAALMDLKANPYEPEPTLEGVINDWLDLRYHTLSTSDLCARIRAAFPHIDTPPEAPKELTADEHIAALVKMGAQKVDYEHDGNITVLIWPRQEGGK